MTLLVNTIDNFLKQLLEDGINVFSNFYIFKVNGVFIVTTDCTTKYYLIEDGKIFENRKKINKKKLLSYLYNKKWFIGENPFLQPRVNELIKYLESI
jgi:hypothetical protein